MKDEPKAEAKSPAHGPVAKPIKIPPPEAPQPELEAMAAAAASRVEAFDLLPGAPDHPVYLKESKWGVGACGGGLVVQTLCPQCPKSHVNGGQRSCSGSVGLETLNSPRFFLCPAFPPHLCGPR